MGEKWWPIFIVVAHLLSLAVASAPQKQIFKKKVHILEHMLLYNY